MAKIKKLGGAIVNQIAAGEVVIQPCSVIKELVENSIDAGASNIEVSFTGSGADELKVMDNGMGMEADDLELCIEAHATSKIQEAGDLYRVVSCGFRGEALASIAEVSHLEITSKTQDATTANVLKRNSKGDYSVSKASRAQGTTIHMKGLFHNVPVRRRFLKSDRAETAQNLDQLRKLALARPHVAFEVQNNGKTAFSLPADQKLEDRVRDLGLFDKKVNFIAFDEEQGSCRVHGLTVAPPDHFGNGQKIHLYVNRRPFKDKSLQQAMLRAYTSYIPERRFPGAIIFLDMDPEDVDVNIHPTKSEVRFREPDVVFKRLYGVVRSKLVDSAQLLDAAPHEQVAVYKTSGLAKTVPMNRQYGGVYENKPDPFGAGTSNRGRPSNPSPAFSPPQTRDGDLPDALQPRFPASAPSTHGDASSETKSLEGQFDPTSSSGSSQPPGSFQSPRSPQTFGSSQEPVSDQTHELASHGTTQEPYFSIDAAPKAYQLLNRFILLEHDDHIELMDQHAIHERVLVNQLAHEDHEKRYTCQTLLVPSILDLPENLGHFSDDISADFDNMGFRLEVDEQNGKVTVHGFPDFLSLERGLKVLEEILEDLSQGLPPDRDALRRDILHRTACRAAIKAGDVLSQDELNGLVAATLTMDSTQSTCPHGRSAIWKISIAEANAMFDRT